MSVRLRWAAAVAILLVAVAVAVWPRSSGSPAGSGGSGDGSAARAQPPSADLVAARAAAALPDCATGPADSGPIALRGIVAECLGTGSRLDAGAALAGRAVLVNVWATWCAPCRDELPVLAAYAAGPDAIPVVGLLVQSPPADALGLLNTLSVRLPMLADVDETVGKALRVPVGLPASFLIGADGTVTPIAAPRVFTDVEQVRATVAAQLVGGR